MLAAPSAANLPTSPSGGGGGGAVVVDSVFEPRSAFSLSARPGPDTASGWDGEWAAADGSELGGVEGGGGSGHASGRAQAAFFNALAARSDDAASLASPVVYAAADAGAPGAHAIFDDLLLGLNDPTALHALDALARPRLLDSSGALGLTPPTGAAIATASAAVAAAAAALHAAPSSSTASPAVPPPPPPPPAAAAAADDADAAEDGWGSWE